MLEELPEELNIPSASESFAKASRFNKSSAHENLKRVKHLIWHEITEASAIGRYNVTFKCNDEHVTPMAKEESQVVVDWLHGFGYNVSVINTIRALDKVTGFQISWSKE